jgi:hypothetical protein
MVGLQILYLKILVAWHICERTTTFAQACHFDNEREVTLYLRFMRFWNRLCAISDTWSWGEVTTCALYDTEKMRTASPKSNGSHSWGQHTSSWPRCVHLLLQASLLSFAVNWSPWNNTTSNSVPCLPPEGGHSRCTGQSLCHQNSIFKTLHNNQSPNHSTSKHLKFAERQATNWFMNVIEWAIQTKTLGNKLVSQTGPIWKVKGTHRTSGHDDQDR